MSAKFIPLPPRSIPGPAPVYHRPTLIATYSHRPDRSIAHDDNSMAYYRSAPLGCDLNHGFEQRIDRDETVEEHLDGICESLMNLRERSERPGGVITWRGMLTRIMTAPWEDREGWEMTAIPLAGSVYLEEYDPPENKARRLQQQSSWAWQSYMGYAYEAFSTVPAGGSDATEDDPEGWSGNVNTNVQWANLVRSAIGDIPICIGGEVDCVDGTRNPGLEKCVELKTNKIIQHEKQDQTFHKKLLKHWAQSWLLGVPTIEIGFRDNDGILRSQSTFETVNIPKFIASLPMSPWRPEPCLHYLHAILSYLVNKVLPSDPTPHRGLGDDQPLPEPAVWRLKFEPRRGCQLFRIEPPRSTDSRWAGVFKEDYVRWKMNQKRD